MLLQIDARQHRDAWRSQHPRRLVPAFILLLAFALRTFRLGAQSLWFDEGWSWHLTQLPWLEMVNITAGDRSPILYYTLLGAWAKLAGNSEFSLRFLSVCADVVTVALLLPLAWHLCRLPPFLITRKRARPGQGSILPAALWAISPFALWYAQETRMYAMLGALIVASCFFLLAYCSGKSSSNLIFSTVLLLLAIHTHYYAIFVLPAQALVLLLCRPCAIKAYTISVLGLVVTVVPWLIFAARGFAYSDGFASPLNTVSGRMSEGLVAFINGGVAMALPTWWPFAIAACFVLALLGVVQAGRSLLLILPLLLGLLPLLAATVAVRLFFAEKSVFHPRYLIYCAPLLLLMLASITNKKAGLLALLLMGALFAPFTRVQFSNPALQRDNVRAATQHVIESLEPGDIAIMTRDNFAARYYDPQQRIRYAAPYGLHGVLDSPDTVLQDINAQQSKRVRLMLWQDDVVDPQTLVEQTLRANGYQIGEFNFGQIRLPLYQLIRWPVEPLALAPISATFESRLALRGYAISANSAQSNWFYVSLQWLPLTRLDRDYKVFIHVQDETGALRFQMDKLTLNALRPTHTWSPGQPLLDGYAKVIPPEVPAGKYRVIVGVYDPSTDERLQTESGDTVALGTVSIER